jgi:6-phosphogluconolactonase/glucosamine-6-phosphate isomerase/deaminase
VKHPTQPHVIQVEKIEQEVGPALCKLVADAAVAAIGARGCFAMAIPGGSVLSMLKGLSSYPEVNWSKVHVFYVNHKCVSMEDTLATHKKALDLFVRPLGIPESQVYELTGSGDAAAEAVAYEVCAPLQMMCVILSEGIYGHAPLHIVCFDPAEHLKSGLARMIANNANALILAETTRFDCRQARMRRAVGESVLPLSSDGLPVFDLMLIGMGSDGHIGSLYPNRPEINAGVTDGWCLGVVKEKPPASVTLTLPVINAAAKKVCAMIGRDKKTGGTKAAAVARAIEGNDPPGAFPAQGLVDAIWILDTLAAESLSLG